MTLRWKRAVALRYDGSLDEVPSVAAKGVDADAELIVRIARRYGVPVVESPELALVLDRLETDASIPRILYETVAVLLHELFSRVAPSLRSRQIRAVPHSSGGSNRAPGGNGHPTYLPDRVDRGAGLEGEGITWRFAERRR
jgi:flagellar biosynthesis protein